MTMMIRIHVICLVAVIRIYVYMPFGVRCQYDMLYLLLMIPVHLPPLLIDHRPIFVHIVYRSMRRKQRNLRQFRVGLEIFIVLLSILAFLGLEDRARFVIARFLDFPDINIVILRAANNQFAIGTETSVDLRFRVFVSFVFTFHIEIAQVIQSQSRVIGTDQQLRRAMLHIVHIGLPMASHHGMPMIAVVAAFIRALNQWQILQTSDFAAFPVFPRAIPAFNRSDILQAMSLSGIEETLSIVESSDGKLAIHTERSRRDQGWNLHPIHHAMLENIPQSQARIKRARQEQIVFIGMELHRGDNVSVLKQTQTASTRRMPQHHCLINRRG
mmetsp:Transcript_43615/g.69883  ORF Transcript_43615/g.69883 Transcript_43615/m.69883 type:complete len:328 (-) Transcript_43615:1240-2223(-)